MKRHSRYSRNFKESLESTLIIHEGVLPVDVNPSKETLGRGPVHDSAVTEVGPSSGLGVVCNFLRVGIPVEVEGNLMLLSL